MSLLKQRWLPIAFSMGLAVWMPIQLLSAPVTTDTGGGEIRPTKLEPREVPGLGAALTAPIFADTRTAPGTPDPAMPPLDPSAPAVPTATVSALQQEALPQAPTLVGLALRSGGRSLALAKASDGQTVMLSPGEMVDGWKLISVNRSGATFRQRGETRQLQLDFKNNSTATGSGAPAASPPPPPTPAVQSVSAPLAPPPSRPEQASQ